MKNNNLLFQRIQELTSLLKENNTIVCFYPFSFAIQELIKTNMKENNLKRFFSSSIKETVGYLSLEENEHFIFLSENLKDGKGTKLLMDIKKLQIKHKVIIILNGKDTNNLNVAIQLKTNAIVHEQSLEENNGALIDAIRAIKLGKIYLDPKFQQIITSREFNVDIPLTNRQIEVINLLKEGLTNQEIAGKLLISQHTVRDHLKEIMRRLNTNSRLGVINIASRIGIID